MKKEKSLDQPFPAIKPEHLRRRAVVYCRQSTARWADRSTGSAADPKSLADMARSYGWQDSRIEIIDEDLGKSGSSAEARTGWQRLQALIDAGQVGAVFVSTISLLSCQVMDFELFRLRAAVHDTLFYRDGQFVNSAEERDRILSELVSMRDRWFAEQKTKARKRDAAISRRRSAHAKKLRRPVRGQRSGRRKNP